MLGTVFKFTPQKEGVWLKKQPYLIAWFAIYSLIIIQI
ncbi:hypothetical protein AsAng_0019910 [Aureispira anguillae]|uniref:Uncharacterized protein n=1 Tax=Aureispira anguillae TaxID=2864201 RepID=A0A915YDV1_9BACT|nr:hypothetical protein AsAng_0019910 [Aureispira anguillae]